MFELVIFDNDGVLVDSERHANGVLAGLLSEAGLPMTVEECVAEFMGGSLARVAEVAEARLGRPLPPDFADRYHALLFERFRSALEPVPDVVWALDRITVPTCVASSGTLERIHRSLAATGLLERFAGRVFGAESVARGKPAPDLFLHAGRVMGVEAAACAVVEDSPLGVEAANAAGMTAFGFARMQSPEQLRHATGGVFTSMRQLPELVRRGKALE